MMEHCLREKSASTHFIFVSLQNGARAVNLVSQGRLTSSYLKNNFSKDIGTDMNIKWVTKNKSR